MSDTPENTIQFTETLVEGELFFQITHVDQMRPFLMSVVSDSNHWMFIGSNGGLTAGRKNPEFALFPYYTDDKLLDSAEQTGSKSIFRVESNGHTHVWEPFSIRFSHLYKTTRNLYKSVYGNAVLFEELNHDLGLTFRYRWNTSNRYGFVRTASLTNDTDQPMQINLLDGLQNIMPAGVGAALQNQSSNLVDAYKRSELIASSGIGIYALSAVIVDKAEPSEALKANVVWSEGMDDATRLLSSLQLDSFRECGQVEEEKDVKAERGAYFCVEKVNLAPLSRHDWTIVANVNQRISSIIDLSDQLRQGQGVLADLSVDVKDGTHNLIRLIAASDGLQQTQDGRMNARHLSNTLFNIMRGGIFDENYQIEKKDIHQYLLHANKEIKESVQALLAELPDLFTLGQLRERVSGLDNSTLKRLCYEYLPLKFSRRHGDPSRPWNQFSINTHDENDGSKILDYEGNWRDIFQNWEALAHSYPEFIEGMIFRFLNASTFDGYNPYRITKNGIDWEKIEPDDPWSYIGYWGDHQIIYLLKFLEFSTSYYPGTLANYVHKDIFVYANVPYRIKPYAQLLENPKDTIEFDHAADTRIEKERRVRGADASLLTVSGEKIYQVNLIEKLLATTLAKMSNFIPEGGIWMNTQRPEWNDANNALVGNGVSMVTLYYLIRFFRFLKEFIEPFAAEEVQISEELLVFYAQVKQVLENNRMVLAGPVSDLKRKEILDGLGQAGSDYREGIYTGSFSGKKKPLDLRDLTEFTDLSLSYLIHSLRANKREDNLYHAYNIMTVTPGAGISISFLSEMLEGQVAVLSSGVLSGEETAGVLDALRKSALFRKDQKSYLLYPEKDLPGFMERNNIPPDQVERSGLLKKMIEAGDIRIIEKDPHGGYHFSASFKNARDLNASLDKLMEGPYAALVAKERQTVLAVFEAVFNHKAFTGRSGTFYGYEGLGSIYWHMVSKLLLAIEESYQWARSRGESAEVLGRLLHHFDETKEGIGMHKSPQVYGAFPTDPYSHTPKGKGAQQPGMTGQVKEDMLSRWGELGLQVREGQLGFRPAMLRKEEFLQNPATFRYVDLNQHDRTERLEKGTLVFTCCQVPVIYELSDKDSIQLFMDSGEVQQIDGLWLDHTQSEMLFSRGNRIRKIRVKLSPGQIRK